MGTPFPITCGSPLAPIDGVPRSSLILAGTALVVAALYFARAILLPVALATVLAFVLSPIVGLLRRWGLGRVPAALLVVLLLFSVLGATTWILASQVMTVLSDVPGYADTIKTKVAALRRMGKGTTLDRARGALNEVVNEMEKDAQPPPAGRAPLPVVVKPSPAPLSGRLPVLLEPLATAGLVLLLVIFMLLERQELRNRFLRILGAGRLTLTTRALDEASARISRFLGTQLAINGTLPRPAPRTARTMVRREKPRASMSAIKPASERYTMISFRVWGSRPGISRGILPAGFAPGMVPDCYNDPLRRPRSLRGKYRGRCHYTSPGAHPCPG